MPRSAPLLPALVVEAFGVRYAWVLDGRPRRPGDRVPAARPAPPAGRVRDLEEPRCRVVHAVPSLQYAAVPGAHRDQPQARRSRTPRGPRRTGWIRRATRRSTATAAASGSASGCRRRAGPRPGTRFKAASTRRGSPCSTSVSGRALTDCEETTRVLEGSSPDGTAYCSKVLRPSTTVSEPVTSWSITAPWALGRGSQRLRLVHDPVLRHTQSGDDRSHANAPSRSGSPSQMQARSEMLSASAGGRDGSRSPGRPSG